MKTTIAPDHSTAELLARLAAHANLSTGDIINRLLGGHLPELHELDAFLEEHPVGAGLYERGVNLIQSYGPESIMDGIVRIAPAGYDTLAARFDREMNKVIGAPLSQPQ